MAILVSWLLCFIFTVTNVFPPEKDKYGYYARTDARQGIIAAAPWFKIPYPCKSPLSLNPHSCRRIVFSNQTGQPAGHSDLLFSFLQQLHIKLSAFTWISIWQTLHSNTSCDNGLSQRFDAARWKDAESLVINDKDRQLAFLLGMRWSVIFKMFLFQMFSCFSDLNHTSFLFYVCSPVGVSYCNSCRCDRHDECGGCQHHRIHWGLLRLCPSLLRSSASHPCHQ